MTMEQIDLDWLTKYEQESHQLDTLFEEQQQQQHDDVVESMLVESPAQHYSSVPHYHERMEASRDFCRRLLNVQLTAPPHCLPERRLYQSRSELLERDFTLLKRERYEMAEKLKIQCNVDQKKEIFYVKSTTTTTVLQFQFANFVTVTYLGDCVTGLDFSFNLYALAQQLLPYYVEYRKKKFAKVNLRLQDAGSHMIYGSAIIVESGSDCTSTSKEMLKLTMHILRHQCHYRRLMVQKRMCFNIVATGNVRDADGNQTALCLRVLKHIFPNASYKKDKFSGVIIKLVDVERHLADQDYHSGQDFIGEEYDYAPEYDSDDDDTELIAEINRDCEKTDNTDNTVPLLTRVKPELVEDDIERNATLEEFAQLATKKENGTFLIFKEGQIICTGCKSKRRLLGAYEKIYWLLSQCTCTPENLLKEQQLSRTGQK